MRCSFFAFWQKVDKPHTENSDEETTTETGMRRMNDRVRPNGTDRDLTMKSRLLAKPLMCFFDLSMRLWNATTHWPFVTVGVIPGKDYGANSIVQFFLFSVNLTKFLDSLYATATSDNIFLTITRAT